MYKKTVNLFCIFVVFAFISAGCGEKKPEGNNNNNNTGNVTGQNSDLLVKDPSGSQKVNLLIKPKKGDVFRYKVSGVQTSDEVTPVQGKEQNVHSEQGLTYYCSMEVSDIDGSGTITYKMKYDSISITSKVQSGDSAISSTYNSNVKDSVYNNPNFIDFNSLVGEYFSLRVSPVGEVYDVFGIERISEKIYKALGDTLKENMKASIKESLKSDVIMQTMQIQNQFQRFPDAPVMVDSSWVRTENSVIPPFQTKNVAAYKLKEIKTENGDLIAVIEGNLGIDFIEKEVKERGVTLNIVSSDAGGSGNITFNLSKGTITAKETKGKVDATIKLSDGKQSVTSKQSSSNTYKIELL